MCTGPDFVVSSTYRKDNGSCYLFLVPRSGRPFTCPQGLPHLPGAQGFLPFCLPDNFISALSPTQGLVVTGQEQNSRLGTNRSVLLGKHSVHTHNMLRAFPTVLLPPAPEVGGQRLCSCGYFLDWPKCFKQFQLASLIRAEFR